MVTEHIERIRHHYTFTLHSRPTFHSVEQYHSFIDSYLKRQKEGDLLQAKLQDQICHLKKEVRRLGEQLNCETVVASNESSTLKRKRTDELCENGGISLNDPAQESPVQDGPAQILNAAMQQEAARVQLIVNGLELSKPGPQGMSSELEAMTTTNNEPS